MKKTLAIILSIICLIFAVDCSAKVTYTIQERNGLIYIPNEATPFTGVYIPTYLNGQKQKEINYKDGKQEGLVIWWDENGQKAKVTDTLQERDGLAYLPNETKPFTGVYIPTYPNQQKKAEINYKDGKQEGLLTSWYENGQKQAESNWKDGKREGLTTFWYENGRKAEIHYKDGKEEGLTTWWYENGQKELEGNYKDGKREGLAASWYENGQKQVESNYKDGKKEGLEASWYENGQKELEGNYKDGKREGWGTAWDENGKKLGKGNFKNDILQ